MDPSAGYEIAFMTKTQLFHKVFKQSCIHFFIIYKTNRFPFAAILYTFLNLLNKSGAHIIVYIYLCVFGYFKNVGVECVVIEIGKYIGKIETYHIFQQNNLFFILF